MDELQISLCNQTKFWIIYESSTKHKDTLIKAFKILKHFLLSLPSSMFFAKNTSLNLTSGSSAPLALPSNGP